MVRGPLMVCFIRNRSLNLGVPKGRSVHNATPYLIDVKHCAFSCQASTIATTDTPSLRISGLDHLSDGIDA